MSCHQRTSVLLSGLVQKGWIQKMTRHRNGADSQDDGYALWQQFKARSRPLFVKERLARERVQNRLPNAEPIDHVQSGKVARAKVKSPKSIQSPNPGQSQKINQAPVTPFLSKGFVTGLDRRRARELARGKQVPEASIDLHGMNRSQAYHAIDQFIRMARAKDYRVVLIVTGKGRGILRDGLPDWLNRQHIRDHILAFDFAPPQFGGDGAFLVVLRRCRRGPAVGPLV